MVEWWNSLAVLQQVFYYIAVPFTVILLIQAVMTIIGLGGNDADADADTDFDTDSGSDFDTDFDADAVGDFDADTDADADLDADTDIDVEDFDHGIMYGFKFFTVRGIVAFFCIFGWTGAALYHTGMQSVWIVLMAAAAGFLAMFVIGLIFYAVKRLQSSGNINYANALGQTASVYIPIPEKRTGSGKVMVMIQERLVEAEAITDEKKKIPTGETVKITGNIGTTLIVKKTKE